MRRPGYRFAATIRVEARDAVRLSVTFAPLHYGHGKDADDFECSILCEWLRFPVLDWRDLNGRRFERPEGQISFYMTEHDPTENMAIDFSERTGRSFVIDISMAVDFHGYFGGDARRAMPVQARLRVPFAGVMVAASLVPPLPAQDQRVLAMLDPFVDLSSYRAPKIRKNDFGVSAYWLEPSTRGAPKRKRALPFP